MGRASKLKAIRKAVRKFPELTRRHAYRSLKKFFLGKGSHANPKAL